ncbi:putative WD repeat-containing protein alr3466 [Nostoc sp, PCC 7120] [Rhizoctonia solani]|uniref:Putative WD repeat-containing protein alr3466 [Nostoc sp, PCC 7120] n=1 Tax=Rhizoctonia solani TaxID=456999 RepID=A0A0K6FNW8_9AGAM|nr:putative WD repeat-containing protein alr3466 [Nostoc sp, PCC 7120] [Rhizoctonia solani]
MSNRKHPASPLDSTRKRFRINSRDPSPTPDQNIPDLVITSPTDSVGALAPTDGTSNLNAPPQISLPTAAPSRNPASKGRGVRSGLKSLRKALESTSDAFGPLKPAIGGLIKVVEMCEDMSKGNSEYEKLRQELEELSNDLAERMTGRIGSLKTNSVQRLIIAIQDETTRLEHKLTEKTGRRLADAMQDSGEIVEAYRRIHDHLQRLMLNVNMDILEGISEQALESRLARMCPAMAAFYNSAESDDVERGMCTPGTREPQIAFLLDWVRDPSAGRTCWMNGMAGTGKTTIAYSVCSQLEKDSQLGASFFCSRAIQSCCQVKNIIPTISYQLARFSLLFRRALDKVLQSHPDVQTRALSIQYKKLLVEPMQESQLSLPTDVVVVIDALDECENENSLGQILDLLLSNSSTLPIKFLVSSRPEMEICRRMMGRVDEQGNAPLVLHDLDADVVKQDIKVYMRRELGYILLTETQWSGILERCGALFIYAATSCRLIKQGYEMSVLDETVRMIVSPDSASIGHEESGIDELYFTILAAAFNRSKMSGPIRQRMKDVLETVICALEPMSLDTLASILRLGSAEKVSAFLQPLRSVINVTAAGIVTTLHASFPDFMLSSDRSKELHCAATDRHTMLAGRCLEIIDAVEPKFNICDLSSSYLSDDQVEDMKERVDRNISLSLIYACRYWSTHLYLGDDRHGLVAVVDRFFSQRLLLWMEILNLTKRMRFGTGIVRDAERWCQKANVGSQLTGLVRDAGHFVSVYANHAISESTPHIYVSMLAFWPRSGPVSVAYMSRTAGILSPTGTAIAQRQPALLATWRVSSEALSMGLSSDGRQIVAATEKAIDMLDTSTGDGVFHLQNSSTAWVTSLAMSPNRDQLAFGSKDGLYLLDVRNEVTRRISQPGSDIYSVVFSPNGSQCAIGLSDGTICLYASQTGQLVLGPLDGHTNWVRTLAFSPSGDSIASGSNDKTLRVWDVANGQMIGRALEGHTDWVLSVSYSPDGTHIASASADGTIRVWDPLTGITTLGPLTEHSNSVRSVTFSPNGAFIASGSDDQTIRVYDAQTGQTVLGPLHGHTHVVKSVIFSPDSTQLYSCSHDGTIRLWSVQDLNPLATSQPSFPRDFLSVRYSPDGLQVVSGSRDGGVCIWDVQTAEIVLGPLQGHSERVLAVDFSPDGAYIVSASLDNTLRLWSAQDGRDIHGPMQGHTDLVYCVRFSPNGAYIVSGSEDSTMRIWDVATGQPTLEPFRGHSGSVDSVAFSPNGALVASGSADRTIRVWDINTGQTVVGPLQGHHGPVNSVEFSPDGFYIISGSWDGSIRMWNAQTGQSLRSWGNDQTLIRSVSFSPEGLLVVSGSEDNSMRIWDAQSGNLLHTLHGHVDPVTSTQFSPDGSHIVSCSSDGVIRFWDMSCRITSELSNRSKGADFYLFCGETIDLCIFI